MKSKSRECLLRWSWQSLNFVNGRNTSTYCTFSATFDTTKTNHNVSFISYNYIVTGTLWNGDVFDNRGLKYPAWMSFSWIWPIGNRALFSRLSFAAVVSAWSALSDGLYLSWICLNIRCVPIIHPVCTMASWNQHRIFFINGQYIIWWTQPQRQQKTHVYLKLSWVCTTNIYSVDLGGFFSDPFDVPWASCQIRKIAGCACAGNAGNVFPRRRLQRKPLVSDPGMHHGTCVTHVPWCMSGSFNCGDGENVPGIPGACAPAILRIWQEGHEK